MDFYRSILKQTDVSLMLAKHVFFSKLRQPNANIVLSPLSIQKVLGMIAAGSKGRSLDQLLSFLKFNSIEELNYVSSRVITDVFADGSPYGGPRLSIAHGVWIDKTLSFKPSFKQIMDNVYKAGCSSVDFLHKVVVILGSI
ncbi:serpin-ZX [Nicotiana tabacum]|uniref:Serpin-ZX n=2 Tax=Nicotiana TaxID=4085 RepID=A0A1S3XYL2_TOBAC|nr:PREDICTED: serpin-ZX [Nicotiana sylvestris]XP_016444802.1 PREDICTED: serpin-ZX-like [Nicotiana tabacum]